MRKWSTKGCVQVASLVADNQLQQIALVLSQYVEAQYASELLADGAGGVG